MNRRNDTRSVNVGRVVVGGGAPVSVQTMCNLDPHDAGAIAAQANSAAAQYSDSLIGLTYIFKPKTFIADSGRRVFSGTLDVFEDVTASILSFCNIFSSSN